MSAPIPIAVRIIGGTVMLASASPFGYFAISILLKNYKRATKGVATTGVVVGSEFHRFIGAGKSVYLPKVEFQTPNGEKITFVASIGSNADPKIGRKVKVLYFPDKPQDAEVGSLLRSWIFPLFLLVCAAVLLMVSLLFYTNAFGNAK